MLEKYYQRIINNSCNNVHFQNNECLYMYNDQGKNLTSDRTTNKFTNSEFVGDIVRNKRSAKWFSGPLRECTVTNVIWKLVCLIAIKIYHKADFKESWNIVRMCLFTEGYNGLRITSRTLPLDILYGVHSFVVYLVQIEHNCDMFVISGLQ